MTSNVQEHEEEKVQIPEKEEEKVQITEKSTSKAQLTRAKRAAQSKKARQENLTSFLKKSDDKANKKK